MKNSLANHIDIMLCQNDDQGNTGKVFMIDFQIDMETCLRLETVDLLGRDCFCNDRIIEIYGVRVKHSGCAEWVGNIHWNCYTVPADYAIGFMNLLLRSRDWSANEGWGVLFEKWHKGEEISGRDLDLTEDVKGIVVNPEQIPLFDNSEENHDDFDFNDDNDEPEYFECLCCGWSGNHNPGDFCPRCTGATISGVY